MTGHTTLQRLRLLQVGVIGAALLGAGLASAVTPVMATSGQAQEPAADPASGGLAATAPFSSGMAATIGAKRWEFGLFQPLKYGVTDDLELSTHPIVLLALPNITAKKAWSRGDRWLFSSEHTLLYPTLALKTMQAGALLGGVPMLNGLVPADVEVGQIFGLNSYALLSQQLAGEHVLTWKLGALLAASFGGDEIPTIDYHVLYTRTAAWHDGAAFDLGADFDGPIGPYFRYKADLDIFVLMRDEGAWAFEQATSVAWVLGDSMRLDLGYKIVVGSYPFGVEWEVFPIFDMEFGF